MANDKPEPAKATDIPTPPSDVQAVHLPSLVELAGGVGAGLKALKYAAQDKVDGAKQLTEQTVNAATGIHIFSKESIDALAPKEHEHAARYTTNWYFEQAGAAVPLVAAVALGHKFLGGAAIKDGAIAANLEKTTAEGLGAGAEVLKRAGSLSLRQTPLGLSVRNAAMVGFASEFVNGTDTKTNDSLLSSLGTRAVDGSIGALSMASMSLGTIGTQAAFRAVGKTVFKDAVATTAESAAVSAETSAAKVSQNVFTKAAETTFTKLKGAGSNALIAGIGGVPGGVVGYVAGSEVHGKQVNFSDLAESAVSSGVVGGMFGAASGFRGNSEATVKSDSTSPEAQRTPLSTRFDGARQAVSDLLFGRQSDAGQLGTAMASDAKGRAAEESRQLEKSFNGFMEFAGGKGAVDSAHVEDTLRRVDAGNIKESTLQFFADGSNSAEQKAFVAASLRPETRAAFLKMMEVSRDGSAPAQDGFVKEVSSDKQTIADLQMMTARLNDPKLIKLVDAAANPVVEPIKPVAIEVPDIKMAASPGSTPVDFDAATEKSVRVKTNVSDEALRHPVADGFVQLLDAAKNSGTPEHIAAFFRAVDANPKIIDGVKELAGQTNLQSVKDLAAMAEKPTLRKAVAQMVEASKDGSSAFQREAFIETVNNDRSTLPDLKKIADRYNDPRLKELVHAADTAEIVLDVKTQKEADDIKSATRVIDNLIRSGGTDTTDLNRIVRDDDSLASFQPHLRHIAERLGGEEIAKKVDEAFAGRFEKVEVQGPSDTSLPRPEAVQTVSVRSNLVRDFNEMTEVVSMLDDALTKPQEEGAVNPAWIYNLLKVKAQSERGQALEGAVKEYAQKTFDPRFQAFDPRFQAFVNDAYLPPEGIVSGPERTFAAANETEQNAFGSFANVMKGWPKVAAGERPSMDDVLNYRHQVFQYLGEHPELHEMVVRYGEQTNSSFEASAIDTYYGTKNLERFPGVRLAKEAAQPVESAAAHVIQRDEMARTLVDGTLDPQFKYLEQVAKYMAVPASLDTQHSARLFNDQPRVTQDNPVAGAGTWSVAEFQGSSIATITGHPENLEKIRDMADGTRIEYYGRNGETEPYTKVYWTDNSSVTMVNPGAEGNPRFKIEFPLQGNYISTDFPADSKVVREIALDGNLTRINRDGSVDRQKIADFKPFDPYAHDQARKTEAQAREAEQRQTEAIAASAIKVERMKTSPDPAVRLADARDLKPENMSVEQFKDWLQYAFEKSAKHDRPNYRDLGENVSNLETMRARLVASFDTEAALLKEYMSPPRGAAFPEWLAQKDAADLPNWLKSDIYQRFYEKSGALDKLPAATVEYFRTNKEPLDGFPANDRGPAKSFPFTRIGDDTVAARLGLLDDLSAAKPDVAARLMELGAQDGSALQDVVKLMTKTFNNNAQYRDLVSSALVNAKDIYSVKVMLEALDRAKGKGTPEEKQVNANLAKEAVKSIMGSDDSAVSTAQTNIKNILENKTTRLENKGPKLEKGAKAPQTERTILSNYTLVPPEAASGPKVPDSLFGAPKPPEVAPTDTADSAADGAAKPSSPGLDFLRGVDSTPPAELPAEPPVESVEAPVEQTAEAPAEPPPPPVEKVEAPAETPEPPLSPAAKALNEKIGEKLTEAGHLGENTVYQTSDGTRDFLIEPSGATYERGRDQLGGQLWKNVNDQSEIWTDGRGQLWNYNSESNFAVARNVPEQMTRQVFTFADDGSDPHNRQPHFLEGSDVPQYPPHLAPRDNVLSSFFKDGSVEFSHMDGSKHTIGPRDAAGKPTYEKHQYPGADDAQGVTVRVNAAQAMTGTLPNGVTFSASDLAGRGTIFTYPDGVTPFEAGATASFDNDTVTINETGKQTFFHRDGTVEEHLQEGESPNHEEPELHSPAIDQFEQFLAGDKP